MLKIQNDKKRLNLKWPIIGLSSVAILGGLYTGLLFVSPNIPKFAQDITPVVSAAPSESDKRIIIPNINVSLEISQDVKSGQAHWQNPESGNPVDGGLMHISADGFNLKSTPAETVNASPFYNLNKLKTGDKIIVDYKASRYGYEVTQENIKEGLELSITNKPNEKIFAKPLGEVQVKN